MNKFNINLSSSRALILFDAAAKTGSFSRAAVLVNVGQPAVNHSVRQLEATLGVKLFRRLHRGVELTPAGEILARRVLAMACRRFTQESRKSGQDPMFQNASRYWYRLRWQAFG